MRIFNKGFIACLLAVCVMVVLAGCQSSNYTPSAKPSSLPSSALISPGTLKVGVNGSSAPLAGKNASSSKIVGIDVDIASYLADSMGLKLEVVDVSTEFADALESKKVDMVLGADSSDDQPKYWRSNPYLKTGVSLFATSSESAVPTIDSNPKIAAQSSSKSSWRVTNLFGDNSLVSQNDLKSTFEALNNGSARYAAADAIVGTYVSFSNGYQDKIIALLQDSSGYCAAVAESNKDLQAAVDSSLKQVVSGGFLDIVQRKWLGETLNIDSATVVKGASGSSSNEKKTQQPAPAEPAAEGEPAAAEEGQA